MPEQQSSERLSRNQLGATEGELENEQLSEGRRMGQGSDQDAGATGQAQELAGKAQEQMAQAGERAQEMADRGRESAADGLERAAEQMRERSPDGGVQGEAMQTAAAGMERAAGYLQDHDTADMMNDIEEYVRAHPMQSVAAAVATGFVVGRILR